MSVLLAGFKLVKLLYVRYSNQHIQPIFNVSCLKVLAMTLRGETILRVLPELLALTPQALKSILYILAKWQVIGDLNQSADSAPNQQSKNPVSATALDHSSLYTPMP